MKQQEFAHRVDPSGLKVTLANGQVRVHLPFAVDPEALSEQLLREGYPLGHPPDMPDSQGWGPYFDEDGYYPYWVYPDPEQPGRSVFAFAPQPEDVISRTGPTRVRLGERSLALAERWVPVLEALQKASPGVQSREPARK